MLSLSRRFADSSGGRGGLLELKSGKNGEIGGGSFSELYIKTGEEICRFLVFFPRESVGRKSQAVVPMAGNEMGVTVEELRQRKWRTAKNTHTRLLCGGKLGHVFGRKLPKSRMGTGKDKTSK